MLLCAKKTIVSFLFLGALFALGVSFTFAQDSPEGSVPEVESTQGVDLDEIQVKANNIWDSFKVWMTEKQTQLNGYAGQKLNEIEFLEIEDETLIQKVERFSLQALQFLSQGFWVFFVACLIALLAVISIIRRIF